MSDSSEDEFSNEWIPYREREDWKDVTPLEQDDGENPVVVIAYSEKFKEVFNYIRAIISSGEKTQRALDLTNDALELNASNYTVWQYRRDILRHLGTDLQNELDYTENMISRNSKNYQVWYHRRVIVEWLNDGEKELEMTQRILDLDAKNYHAWQHRQWAIKTYNLFDFELIFVDRLIAMDVRNNSAWNQRYFVLNHTGLTAEVIERELKYVMNRIQLVKNNESTWNFLRGLLEHGTGKLDQHPEVVEFCEDLYASGVRSPFLLAFLIDLYEERCLDSPTHFTDDQLAQFEQQIEQLCDALINTHDTIRARYWDYILNKFKTNLSVKRGTQNGKESNGHGGTD